LGWTLPAVAVLIFLWWLFRSEHKQSPPAKKSPQAPKRRSAEAPRDDVATQWHAPGFPAVRQASFCSRLIASQQ
jgi:hypothetical protein